MCRLSSSEEVIRSALALKLHCFEDTGAIVAAMTTSIPESPGSGRTWDYRYCWLRDAYYALSAFRLLGHFEEREQFVRYLINVASATLGTRPRPALPGGRDVDLEEQVLDDWPGSMARDRSASGTPRREAAAARRLRGDGPGALSGVSWTTASAPSGRAQPSISGSAGLGARPIAVAGTPDAGIWELRNGPKATDLLEPDVLGRSGSNGERGRAAPPGA